VNELTIKIANAKPSLSGPTINQKNNGTPSNRKPLSAFGIVQLLLAVPNCVGLAITQAYG
jgi:hypothetical protein